MFPFSKTRASPDAHEQAGAPGSESADAAKPAPMTTTYNSGKAVSVAQDDGQERGEGPA